MEVIGKNLNLIPNDSVLVRSDVSIDDTSRARYALYDHCSEDGESLFFRLQSIVNQAHLWNLIARPAEPPRSIVIGESSGNRSIVSRGTIEDAEESLSK